MTRKRRSAAAKAALEPIASRLMELADADTRAFNDVMAAYRLPKATDEEKAARTGAIQAALRGATEIPLETLRACADALAHGATGRGLRQSVGGKRCRGRDWAAEGGGGRRGGERPHQSDRIEGRSIQGRDGCGDDAVTGGGCRSGYALTLPA